MATSQVGLTTSNNDVAENDKPEQNTNAIAAKQCNSKELSKLQQSNKNSSCGNTATDDEDTDKDDEEEKAMLVSNALNNVNVTTASSASVSVCKNDLTSIAISERYKSIAKLLEQQHCIWQSQQQKLPGHQTATTAAISPAATNIHPDRNCSVDDGAVAQEWAAADSYNLTAYNQINGVWPLGHPLPLPDWSTETKDVLHLDNVWQYEDLTAIIETTLQRMLEETHYNTVNLFIDFYRTFKRTKRSDLKSFYQFYDLPINRRHHMCVSLAFEIMARLIKLLPTLAHYLYVVSCEEQVVQLIDYIEVSEAYGLNSVHANAEKEHAMVAMKLSISGRDGVLILDPGYHVGRAVTVMLDQVYPHTGWFVQSKEAHLQRDYCYNYSPHCKKFIEWQQREIRGDTSCIKSSLVYIEQEYMTAIDVTVRRNLVYNFRSLLARDAKGRVFAGIYFPVLPNVHEAYLTLFYDGPNEQRIKIKLMFNVFKANAAKLPDNMQQHMAKLAAQLNMQQRELIDLCKMLAEVVTDQDFIRQVLIINDDIANMSTEN